MITAASVRKWFWSWQGYAACAAGFLGCMWLATDGLGESLVTLFN